jgi:hypothetical protein
MAKPYRRVVIKRTGPNAYIKVRLPRGWVFGISLYSTRRPKDRDA